MYSQFMMHGQKNIKFLFMFLQGEQNVFVRLCKKGWYYY